MVKYLRNAWYVVAFSDELNQKPLARKILDENLVFYRDDSGKVSCLIDRCPHRFAPLSLGSVVDGSLRCDYHGLRFDGKGTCVHNPHGDGKIPPNSSIKSYHVIEKYNFIWLWAGNPEKADESKIPDYSFLSTPEKFSVVKGYLHVQGNYQLVVDNLLDLSHAAYLHPEFAIPGMDPEKYVAAATMRLERNSEESLTLYRMRSGIPPNPATAKLFGFDKEAPVDTRTHMTWHAPALMSFDLGTCLPDSKEENGLCIPQAHCMTPETELTCHYFFACGRNMRHDDKDVDEALFALLDNAFRNQDEPMIGAVQNRMGATSDFDSQKPVLLSIDAAPVAARRALRSLISKEESSE